MKGDADCVKACTRTVVEWRPCYSNALSVTTGSMRCRASVGHVGPPVSSVLGRRTTSASRVGAATSSSMAAVSRGRVQTVTMPTASSVCAVTCHARSAQVRYVTRVFLMYQYLFARHYV